MLSKEELDRFDSDGVGVGNGNFFGFPYSVDSCDLVLQRVPWDVTVSYGAGTSKAPQDLIEASTQVEIYDNHFSDAWKRGIATLNEIEFARKNNESLRVVASEIIADAESGGEILSKDKLKAKLDQINCASKELNSEVYKQAKEHLNNGKLVGLVGGDHSTPFGLIKALSEIGEFGILHIDAHCDLRDAYEGFEFSHASIMRNALTLEGVKKLVQVGVRDYSLEELEYAKRESRISHFLDQTLNERRFHGDTWNDICQDIINALPQRVYVSFDIDGLQQQFCPSTGTPVPGGLTYAEAVHLLYLLRKNNKEIVGFDLNEVGSSDNEWDANVGARILYKLCNLALSN